MSSEPRRAARAGGLALLVLAAACGDDATGPAGDAPAVTEVAIEACYGIHDTFVRDGLAFVATWNRGIQIYDVGNGVADGTPSAPALVSRTVVGGTDACGGGAATHNAWWFHDPDTDEARYLFVGQEGPGSIGSSSSGDIYVLDVSNLAHPVPVSSFHLPGAGTHNFWVDEARRILYAAYYNGGVVAIDVSGTLPPDLSSRVIDRILPGGEGETFTWGVMVQGDALYASDMLTGLHRLQLGAGSFTHGGTGEVTDRYTSDLWVHGDYAYTGTWGVRAEPGNTVYDPSASAGIRSPADCTPAPSRRSTARCSSSPRGTRRRRRS